MSKTEVVAVKLSLMAEKKLRTQINIGYITNLKNLAFKTRTLRLYLLLQAPLSSLNHNKMAEFASTFVMHPLSPCSFYWSYWCDSWSTLQSVDREFQNVLYLRRVTAIRLINYSRASLAPALISNRSIVKWWDAKNGDEEEQSQLHKLFCSYVLISSKILTKPCEGEQ